MSGQDKSKTDFWKCPGCKKVIQKKRLIAHLKENHGNMVSFMCKACRMEFANEIGLNKHQSECEKVPDAPKTNNSAPDMVPKPAPILKYYDCVVCSKRFTSESNLESHEKMIHGENSASIPFVNITNRTNQAASDVKEKLRKNASDSPSKVSESLSNVRPKKSISFDCPHCNLKFGNDFPAMNIHLKKTHPAKSNTLDKKVCPHCNKFFLNKLNLKAHIHDEHEKVPLTCECGKQFGKYLQLQKHRHWRECEVWKIIHSVADSCSGRVGNIFYKPENQRSSFTMSARTRTKKEETVSKIQGTKSIVEEATGAKKVLSSNIKVLTTKPELVKASQSYPASTAEQKKPPITSVPLDTTSAMTLPAVSNTVPSDFLENKFISDAIDEKKPKVPPTKKVVLKFPGKPDQTVEITVPSDPNSASTSIVTDGDQSYLLTYKNGKFSLQKIAVVVQPASQ